MKRIIFFITLSFWGFQVAAQNVGIGTTSPKARLHVADSSVLFSAVGGVNPFFQAPPPISGAGRRMMWYADKAAFRTGNVTGTQWDKDSIGYYSAAFGLNTKAMANFTFASGNATTASGLGATALGLNTIASESGSTAFGTSAKATNENATAMGNFTNASGISATAMGSSTKATGNQSTTMGYGTEASGNTATAMGLGTVARSLSETVVGQYNVDYTPIGTSTFDLADRIFSIGNGIDAANRNNAFTVLKGGNTGIGTTLPALGKLVVRGTVGAVSAMFGDDVAGVSIMNNVPSIGFNYYFSGTSKAITTGFGSQVGIDQSSGKFFINTSPTSVTGAGTTMPLTERLNILPNGNMGISFTNPTATLTVGRGTTTGGTARFDGTDNASHFNINTTEDTYIRGGKTASKVFINDVGNGNVLIAPNGGNVGIGNSSPGAKLDVSGYVNIDKGLTVGGGLASGNALQVNAVNGYSVLALNEGLYPTIYASNQGTGFPLEVNGRVNVLNNGSTAGIWFNKSTNVKETGSFIGNSDDRTFGVFGNGSWKFLFDVVDNSLRIGTGTKASGYMLNVGGKIIAEEVRVQLQAAWPDYVFADNYKLRSLKEVEDFIATNNHLPNVPAAAEVEKSGIALGEMQGKMMEKIEELTLYIIQLKKENEVMKQSITVLQKNSQQ